MAFRAGRREKLAGGIIIVLVGIALLHYFIFQPKQGAYRKAKGEFDAASQRYSSMKQAPTSEITPYQNATATKASAVQQLMSDINPCFPEYFLDAPRMQGEFLEYVKQIDNLRTNYPSVKWDFLGPNGWDFATQLPEDVRRGRIVIQDLVSNIRSTERLIQRIANPNEKILRQQEYTSYLFQLGVNMKKALAFSGKPYEFGEIVPNLHLAHHAMLITKAMPADSNETITQLLEFLRPGFNKKTFFEGVTMHTTNKQLEALVDILKSAATHEVETVSSVSIFMIKKVKAKIDPSKATPEPTPMAMSGEFFMGDPSMMYPGAMGGEEGEMFAGAMPGMDPSMFPGGMPGMAPGGKKPEEVVEDAVGNATGFKIRFVAQNSNAMKYIYDLANGRRAYVIDDLAVNTMSDGRVEVIVTVVAYIAISDVCK